MSLEEFGTDVEQEQNQTLLEAKEVCCEEGQDRPVTGGLVSWSSVGGNSYMGAGTTRPTLPSGMYTLDSLQGNPVFRMQTPMTDDLIAEGNANMELVLNEIRKFWKLEDNFQKFGYLHKRGIILYGQQGCGKSAVVQLVSSTIIEEGGLVLFCNNHPDLTKDALYALREIEKNRKIVCVFEDVEALVESKSRENSLLSILDGEIQINNVLNLATTNYPEKLDRRIISRPRRFDRILKIEAPDETMRRKYFEHKTAVPDKQVEEWVEKTDGLSFASLAEAVISVFCLENDFEETIKRLREMEIAKTSSDEYWGNKKVGFGSK